MQEPLAWDDLRLVLAIRRGGGLSGAARELGRNHATVFRRLGAVEARLGVRLFDRARSGYVPTHAGVAAADLALRMEEEIAELRRGLEGQDQRPEGLVRLATIDALAFLVGRCQPELRAANPGVTLELLVSGTPSDLARREADLAFRALRPEARQPSGLFGRRVGAMTYAAYGARGAFAPDRPLADLPWVAPSADMAHTPTAAWMAARVAEARVAARANSLLAIGELVRAGTGVGLLPCFLGDRDPGLERLGNGAVTMTLDLWMLTHEDLRGVARIRATLTALAAAVAARRSLLEGEGRGPEPA